MKKNYYAVKVGARPGIYYTWKECEENVIGFPGAKYKGFVSQWEAIEYFTGKPIDKAIDNYNGSGKQEAEYIRNLQSDDSAPWD